MDQRTRDANGRSTGIEVTAASSRQVPPGRTVPRPHPPQRYRYTIAELEEETGVSARTIRYYVGQGLLAPAYGRGPSATYDLGHLLRLRLIQHLKEQRYTLTQIKDHLSRLTDEEIERMLGVESRSPEDVWRRIRVSETLELHVRQQQQKDADYQKSLEEAVDGIVTYARAALDHLEGAR